MKRTYIQPCAVAYATATTGQLLAGSGSGGEGGPDIIDKGQGGDGSDINNAKGQTVWEEEEEEHANEVAQSFSLPRYSVWD